MTLELERRKDKHLDAVLILVTDGRTNRAGKDGDPVAEALALGAKSDRPVSRPSSLTRNRISSNWESPGNWPPPWGRPIIR